MTTTRLKTRSNSAFRLIDHLVLVTKFRNKSLTNEMVDRVNDWRFRGNMGDEGDGADEGDEGDEGDGED